MIYVKLWFCIFCYIIAEMYVISIRDGRRARKLLAGKR